MGKHLFPCMGYSGLLSYGLWTQDPVRFIPSATCLSPLPLDKICLSSITQSLHLLLPFPSAFLRHGSLSFGLLYILNHLALLPLLSFITLPLFLFSNSKLIIEKHQMPNF